MAKRIKKLENRIFECTNRVKYNLHIKRDGEWLTLGYSSKERVLEDVAWFNKEYPNRMEEYRIEETGLDRWHPRVWRDKK